MNPQHDAIRILDAMSEADRQAVQFSTTHVLAVVERDPMQTTRAAHEIGAALSIPVEILDAARTNLNDLQHPSPLRDMVEHTSGTGGRRLIVLRSHRLVVNDRRVLGMAAMLRRGSRLVVAVDDMPPDTPGWVFCDLRTAP